MVVWPFRARVSEARTRDIETGYRWTRPDFLCMCVVTLFCDKDRLIQ